MRFTRRAPCLAAAALIAGSADAQACPGTNLTRLLPRPAGAVVDTPARLLGDPLAKLPGQAVVSSSVCPTWRMLKALQLPAMAPDAGALPSGRG